MHSAIITMVMYYLVATVIYMYYYITSNFCIALWGITYSDTFMVDTYIHVY